MPSFPTSVFAPTTKSAGQVIQPADVNDLQDEVIAVEGAIVNGPLTLASATITGALVVSGSAQLPRRPSAQVTHSTLQAVATGTFTGLSWDTESDDSTGIHSTASNSSRLVLNSSGVWLIGANVDWSDNSSGIRILRVIINDTLLLQADVRGAVSGNMGQSITARYLTTSTSDYATIQVFQGSGSTGSISTGGGNTGRTLAWVQRVSD